MDTPLTPAYALDWLGSFVLTLGVELPVCWWLLRAEGAKAWRILAAAAAASTLTHPVLWFLLPGLFSDYLTFLVTCEVGIAVVEAGVLYLAAPVSSPLKALGVSVGMNGASLGVGLVLNAWR